MCVERLAQYTQQARLDQMMVGWQGQLSQLVELVARHANTRVTAPVRCRVHSAAALTQTDKSRSTFFQFQPLFLCFLSLTFRTAVRCVFPEHRVLFRPQVIKSVTSPSRNKNKATTLVLTDSWSVLLYSKISNVQAIRIVQSFLKIQYLLQSWIRFQNNHHTSHIVRVPRENKHKIFLT